MKSKSKTKFKEAITTTNKLIPILSMEALLGFMIDIPLPKKLIIKLMRYIINIPPVAANIPSLKFSVGLITPVLYTRSKAARIPNVKKIAWLAIPGYCVSNILDIPKVD